MSVGAGSFSFEDVRRVEFGLMTDLSRLRGHAARLGLGETVADIDESIQRIQTRRFVIAVVGEFKRGKSTFINALLGKEILPADIMPTSATLNRVSYGLQPGVQVIFKDEGQGERVENVGIDELANYVTKLTEAAEATAARVKEAIVYYPIRYCQNNVHIYDTPGLNDDEAMTTVTLSVLPWVDAAIMVIMPNAPFSGYEGDFLNKLLMNELGSVIFVVTAMDRLRRDQDRERALHGIAQRIKMAVTRHAIEQFGQDSDPYHQYLRRMGEPKVYGVSGYDAVQAKIDGDPERLARSGFPQFEAALEKFLTEDRGAVTLKVISDRVIAAGEKISKTIDVQQGALHMHEQEFHAAQQATLSQLEALRRRSVAEMAQLDAAREAVQAHVQEILRTMATRMVRISDGIIDETPLTNADLNRLSLGAVGSYMGGLISKVPEDVQGKSKQGLGWLKSRVPANLQDRGRESWQKLAEKVPENRSPIIEEMAQRITDNLQDVAETLSAEIQPFIQGQLTQELERVRAFARATDDTLQRTEALFSRSDEVKSGVHNVTTGSLMSNLAVITELGELWSGDHLVEMRNVAAGSIASIGDSLGSGWQSLRSKLLGAREEQAAPPNLDRVTAFKLKYRQAVAEEVAAQVTTHRAVQGIQQQVVATFDGLKRRVAQEVEAAIGAMEAKLADLQRKRERSLILKERDAGELAAMRQEVQEILARAYQLSDRLLQIVRHG